MKLPRTIEGWLRGVAKKATKIRVLRIIEYVYDTPEVAERDMASWTHSLSMPNMRFKSATIPFETSEFKGDSTNAED